MKLRALLVLPVLGLAVPAVSTAQSPAPAAAPKPGRWEATVSNGYKGDKITFVVAPGAKSITDVLFEGYWRCGSSPASNDKTIESSRVGPPKPVALAKGAFADKQTVPSWWWEFAGRFTSPTTAEGTYRQASGGGACDSYLLKWTAKRVG